MAAKINTMGVKDLRKGRKFRVGSIDLPGADEDCGGEKQGGGLFQGWGCLGRRKGEEARGTMGRPAAESRHPSRQEGSPAVGKCPQGLFNFPVP